MMTPDDKRKNFWDDEEEDDDRSGSGSSKSPSSSTSGSAGSEEVDRKINEARVMMEQTHQLYQNYFSGLEKRPPIEKVKQLDAKIAELQRTSSNLTTAKFKMSQFLAQFAQMKDLWERKLRDRERS